MVYTNHSCDFESSENNFHFSMNNSEDFKMIDLNKLCSAKKAGRNQHSP